MIFNFHTLESFFRACVALRLSLAGGTNFDRVSLVSGGSFGFIWFHLVSFYIFRIILVSKEEKNHTIKSKDKGLSLSKFS